MMTIDYLNPTNKYQAWKMLGILFIVQMLIALVGRSLAPFSPLFEEDLSLSKAQIGMLPAALFLGQALISVHAGYFVDRIGTKNMMIILSICLGTSFALLSLSAFYPFSNYYWRLWLRCDAACVKQRCNFVVPY